MDQVKLSRRAVIGIATGFVLLLLAGGWWRYRSHWVGGDAYYQDAAKIQASESFTQPPDANTPPPAIPDDKAYQPEKGSGPGR